MSECKANTPPPVQRGFETKGPLEPPTIQSVMGRRQDGLTIMSNGMNVELMNALGGGFATYVPPYAGPVYKTGEEKDISGQRGTKSFMAGTADTSKPSLVCLCGTDRSGIFIDNGGGRASTVTIATGDGQSGMVFGKGYVAIWCEGTEVVLWGAAGGNRVLSTKQIVWEPSQGSGKRVTAVA